MDVKKTKTFICLAGLEATKTHNRDRPHPISSQTRIGGMSRQTESRSTRTYTVTEGSGPNAVTKTVVEETIIKADGSKVTNKTETVTRGAAGGGTSSKSLFDKDTDKDKKGGFGGVGFINLVMASYRVIVDMPAISRMRLEDNDSFSLYHGMLGPAFYWIRIHYEKFHNHFT
ncbi:hypothetical protein KUTeg_001303 [Tegillarca granosa]|uniref:Uncharacterized protein n=1 Tax=Tegillarca granosa TaxID=220873 RepID=A0ABQ9FZR6_TEGGR|nr:hypothetical protein KUTeg_001303 [Tegillarca granosa]